MIYHTAIHALARKAYELCHAKQSEARDENLANLAAMFLAISGCIQHMAPEHDEAGDRFERLADACNRSQMGPPVTCLECPCCGALASGDNCEGAVY